MNSNLSPRQFARQAADFHKWAKGEQQRAFEEHSQPTPTGGRRASYPPEVGRRLARLSRAQTDLTDAASYGFYSKDQANRGIGMPLREVLDPASHDLVDEWEKSRDDR